MNWETITSIIITLGGFEGIKWGITTWINRKTNARRAETQADSDEFHLLRERLELSDKQLLDKEQRFHEQTQLVRELNKQLLELKNELFNLRFQHAVNQLDTPQKIVETKKTIAKILTVLREKEIAANK